MDGIVVEKIKIVFSDTRGEITDLLNKEISHVGLITTTKNSTRGNHYHKKSIQYSYIYSGKFEVLVANCENIDAVEKIILNSGELITIQPGIVHTFTAIEDAVMIDMISISRSDKKYEDDVIKGIILKH